MGEVTSDNWNLRNLRYNGKIFHVMLVFVKSESVPITSNYPSKTVSIALENVLTTKRCVKSAYLEPFYD